MSSGLSEATRPLLAPALALAALAAMAALGGVTALAAAPASAQEPDSIPTPVPVDSVVVAPGVPVVTAPLQDTAPRPMTPRGAFIRSMILPGWGQSAFGSYFRGGVFFAGWAGNWFMNFRNHTRLDEAEHRYGMRVGELRDSLVASCFQPVDYLPGGSVDEQTCGPGAPNRDSVLAWIEGNGLVDAAVRNDEAGNDLRKLVRSREQQREDWIAWSIFWILASGVDGYVTAHLADFPATIDVDPARDGSVSFRMTVPLWRREP